MKYAIGSSHNVNGRLDKALDVETNGLYRFENEAFERNAERLNEHVHFCTTCQNDYPCVEQHYRTDEKTLARVPVTPPRATKHCSECLFMAR